MAVSEIDVKRGSRRRRALEAGFKVPVTAIAITGPILEKLTREGWRLYIDEAGILIGYLPPNIRERLEAL